MKILLIRHGETELQKEKRYQGITDVPLSAEGAKKLKPFQRSPEKVYVTPLIRTQQTASILFPAALQVVVPELSEMNFGRFEGRNYIEMKDDPDYRAWVEGMCNGRCPGGESRQEYCSRVCDAFEQLVSVIPDQLRDLVIVAHGGTQMAVLERFGEEDKPYWEWQLPPGQGYLLDAESFLQNRRLKVITIMDFNAL